MKKIKIDHPVDGRELQRHTIRTQKEVGQILGISAEAVRIIEQRAMAKCRKKLLFYKAQLLAK